MRGRFKFCIRLAVAATDKEIAFSLSDWRRAGHDRFFLRFEGFRAGKCLL